MRKKIVFILIALVLIVSVGYLWQLKAKGKKRDFSDLKTIEVKRGDIAETVVATGSIYPKAKIEVKSKIGGVVHRFFVEEGDYVKEGDPLAEVVPGATPLEVVKAREELKSAEAEMEKEEQNYRRSKELFNKGLISKKDFESAKTAYFLAEARYYAAKAQLQVLGYRGGKEKRSSPKDKESSEASYAIKSMIVRSPLSGIVLNRDTDEGSAVIPISSASGGTVIMTLGDISEMHFRGDVDEVDVAKIRVGMPVRVHVDSYPDRVFNGELIRISPLGKKKEDVVNFEVRVKFLDDTSPLRVGMSADAEIVIQERKNVLFITEGAIERKDGKAYVYLFDPTTETGKRKKEIKTGISDGIKTEVVEGLKEGDKVVMP